MIYNAYDSTKYLLDLYEQYMPDALASGGFNKEDLVGFFDAFGVAGKINLMIKVLNDLEIFDALLAPITVISSNPTMVEMWANGDWGETTTITRSEGSEIKKRTLTIPAKSYGHQINIDKNELIRAMSQARVNGRDKSAFVAIDMFIQVAVSGYRSLLRKLALKALFAKPTSEDPTLPILYRDTTGFATENQVVPPRNGLMEFETGVSQEHHLASNGVTEDILKKMKKLIVDKGGNGASVAIWASESSWELLRAQYTKDELEALKIVDDMNLDQIFKSPLTGTMNISLPDSDMPLNYWVALDMSKKILQKRISDTPELQGVNVDFNTLPKIQAMNPNAPMETMRAMAEDALISATVTGQLKLSISSVGYGIINAGAGVTAFTGSPTSVYVEPNWFI